MSGDILSSFQDGRSAYPKALGRLGEIAAIAESAYMAADDSYFDAIENEPDPDIIDARRRAAAVHASQVRHINGLVADRVYESRLGDLGAANETA